MEYDYNRDDEDEPSLTEMVEFAIKTLQQDPNGFVLLVEGKFWFLISQSFFFFAFILVRSRSHRFHFCFYSHFRSSKHNKSRKKQCFSTYTLLYFSLISFLKKLEELITVTTHQSQR